ncbi:hypothetical protein HBH56_197000 [Parastagonospora nodorum]|uniref:Uncharacterized protein n=2 Tax=Phaeosphaeria nodorum (strain SN15 / ATCC MYA-4574 / FGSC 10173) TaxID=321614 RepID=A0A7U2HZE9_PHANO|nr:hypothetical protein SNOG_08652 [Parastagonospora nodorum SN15]KAH3906742.1 hypothetical protein HBH56_197000 [Parastagonospora nodorum]EAT83820.1 hypothetical protein SNOG_08652 [Parastagonospora nodorum SN15]KAH3924657.1 hypothetical protein HBH54_189960 [Parastagonospora nodorum]KAH3966166.1 hypothetical protein HBH52_200440 [Parastagonospora nodorum]KAH3973378.1 hypothetical protein HBH51_099030 [Parastagonospora nodorum]
MASTTESVTYGELVQYANEHFSQEFKSLPLLSTIKIQKFGGKESDRDYAGPPRAENYRVCIARTKKDVLGKQPVRIIITTTSDKIAEYDPWYSQYITALSRPSEYELYDPFHHVSGSEEQSCKLRMIVLSLYYVMRSGLATSCVLDRESSKIGLLETFKEVCSLVFAAKAASKTVLEQPQNDRQYVIRLRLCPDLLMQFQDGEMSPNGGVPQPAPSIHDSIAVIPAKRTLMGLRPRNSRASDRGVPTAKRIKVTAHPPAHQTETGYTIINSMHEIVQKGEIAEAALTEAKEAIATLIAQQDALQTENNNIKIENNKFKTENNKFKTENEQLSNEKRASEVAAAESMRSHNQLVAEYDTAQITIRDLDARIAAITSERANVSQELTISTTDNGRLMTEIASLKQQVNAIAAEKDGHFKEQITALERDKNMLNTQNADLKEDRDKLKKGFRDAVSELEAYKKRVLALGNE